MRPFRASSFAIAGTHRFGHDGRRVTIAIGRKNEVRDEVESCCRACSDAMLVRTIAAVRRWGPSIQYVDRLGCLSLCLLQDVILRSTLVSVVLFVFVFCIPRLVPPRVVLWCRYGCFLICRVVASTHAFVNFERNFCCRTSIGLRNVRIQ
jgi:hypothetical protein